MDTATGDIRFHMVLMCRDDHLGKKMVVGHLRLGQKDAEKGKLHQLKGKQK